MTGAIIPACVFLLLLLDVSVCDQCGSSSDSPARSLRRHLMCGYDKNQRPVLNKADKVHFTILLWLSYIQIDEYSDSISVFAFIILNWQDQFLRWDPLLYDNENRFSVDPSTIWTPTLALSKENRVSGSPPTLLSPRMLCALSSTGHVHCSWPTVFRAPCRHRERRWPLGAKRCRLLVQQWDQDGDGDKVNMTLHELKVVEALWSNGTWELVSYDATLTAETSVLGILHRAEYTFVLRRRWTVTSAFVFASALSAIVLTLSPLTLRHSQKGRLSVVLVDVVLHVATLQTLGFLVDRTIAGLPLVVIFFRSSLLMATVSLLLTVIWKFPLSGMSRFLSAVKMSQELDKILAAFRLKSEAGEQQAYEENSSFARIIRVVDLIFLVIFVIAYVALCSQFLP